MSRFLISSCIAVALSASPAVAQQVASPIQFASVSSSSAMESLPDAPDVQTDQQAAPQTDKPAAPPPQPKRILGLMPNYRAVSAGVKPPPATPKQAFAIATRQSFDYSAFVFVGATSLIAEANNSRPKLGKGVGGFWAYSWRGYVDKTDGNYWVVAILPTLFHEDERYYAMGKGSFTKRALYSVSRVAITPDYHGHNTINGAELLGRGIAQGISTTYYPSSDNTAGKLAGKYALALMRDAATNAFREFWPDIATHILHRNP